MKMGAGEAGEMQHFDSAKSCDILKIQSSILYVEAQVFPTEMQSENSTGKNSSWI